MGKYKGYGPVALKPRSTEQVAAVLRHCNQRRLAVVPQGGNTGLVGGSIPVFDEIVLSMGSMNKILGFDPVGGTLTCQAGCILEELDNYVARKGYMVPLDLGAKGSCHIGGNVATNAGGLRLLRYGSLHGTVLGLEAVLPDGTVLDTLTTLRKDNTGYDLKQLFIGSEGTLGVVTAVALLCPHQPTSVQVAYLACPSFEAATQVLGVARRCLGEILSAMEFLDRDSLEITLQHLPGTRDPLPGSSAPFFVVVETSGADSRHDVAKFENFIETAMQEGCVADGILAQDTAQAAGIWRIREGITESLRHRGAIYKYDLSMPVDKMYALVEDTRVRLDGMFPHGSLDPGGHAVGDHARLRVVGYGHLGDGNLHLNVSAPMYDDRLRAALEPFVYEWAASVKGSISAEHGLGAMKADVIGYSKTPEAVALMRKIKDAIDPHGIMNPYKVLPPLQGIQEGETRL